ncbi:OmpA family protein [Glaesserella parasuis]|uniref:Lipoprotein Plp4/outer membrane protein and related peptidoglycan-associated (Lipo)proteins n=2 Tax=Glaesserella parasuis TaxID=738 RepID=B8F3R1_GLAP5|nr:OmpA family protein [Glaesserella parasuis]ACL31963.1 lipoprotein Plp4/outer membrane protein and related peptidoglycan-associated (lipo)proteins [Glaesserella parasuis SH0165]AIK89641.1 plastocyanin [Glaesserella parasuis]EMY45896.1 lipoprotein Plp4/outer membrane protein [Glaesserella parasuis gx033]KDD81940.1 plastocyanin [Glaesserella parasuis ST4-2]MCT8784339.1 OmpA family protein [Glaesserella parasuis]
MKKTIFFRGVLSAIAITITACGSLSKVSDEGTTEKPVFPKIPESKFNHDGSQFGSWPNWENVRQIEKGMNKDQLYNLIGPPHFSEGLYEVHEWDYAFNYREKGVHKICQFKILFDKNMNAQSFFWYPNGCNGNSSFNLVGDFLFDFDKDILTTKGREVVDDVAEQLKSSGAEKVKLVGYADRLGSEEYNLDLSQRRANMVKARLVEQGIKVPIEAVGYGKANQVKACDGESGQALRDCLRPNRRVEITANGGVLKQNESGNVAGPQGPAPLYQTPSYNPAK